MAGVEDVVSQRPAGKPVDGVWLDLDVLGVACVVHVEVFDHHAALTGTGSVGTAELGDAIPQEIGVGIPANRSSIGVNVLKAGIGQQIDRFLRQRDGGYCQDQRYHQQHKALKQLGSPQQTKNIIRLHL